MTALETLPTTLTAGLRIEGLDLHLHSQASDGALSPTALMALCHQRGLGRIALTDHDTLNGVAEARQAARRWGIGVLAGAELSSQWTSTGIHVVALMPEGEAILKAAPTNPLAQMLARLWQARSDRASTIAERLERKGLDNALASARSCADGRLALGRPHFAAALVKAGLVADMKTAFKRYLGAGKIGDVKLHWPEFASVVAAIAAGGGIAVLAHPLRYGLTRRRRVQLLDDFVAAGGEAVELCSGYQNDDQARDLARSMEERQLFASFGSDFHQPGGPIAPGSFALPPRCAVKPIWMHPRLRDWFAATEQQSQAIMAERQALKTAYAESTQSHEETH